MHASIFLSQILRGREGYIGGGVLNWSPIFKDNCRCYLRFTKETT